MLEIKFTNKMKRDVKRMKKRGKDMIKLTTALNLLASQAPMPKHYFDWKAREPRQYNKFPLQRRTQLFTVGFFTINLQEI
jgi:mRNA-degrading endonuclease YafQ of YafQ-DinJ toxin-antitoxin module